MAILFHLWSENAVSSLSVCLKAFVLTSSALLNVNCIRLQVHLEMFCPRNKVECQKNLLLKDGPCRLNTRQEANHTSIYSQWYFWSNFGKLFKRSRNPWNKKISQNLSKVQPGHLSFPLNLAQQASILIL